MGAQSKDTQLRVERIMRSKMYQCGDLFSAAHMYTQLAGESKDAVKYALEHMCDKGSLNKRTDKSGNTHYSRPPRSIASIPFRHDNDVYELIDQLNRGW